MKYLIASLLLAVSTATMACKVEEAAKPKEPETKRVCIKVYDAQQKKEVEKCKVTQIFEKKEGTPIPKN